jgi:hypothetical protein
MRKLSSKSSKYSKGIQVAVDVFTIIFLLFLVFFFAVEFYVWWIAGFILDEDLSGRTR